MKLVFSELSPDYKTYTFPHAVYAIAENGDEISDIYNSGFLPYSGDMSLQNPTFYLSRSLRIDLNRFSDSSENRRVDRKMELENINIRSIPTDQFDKTDAEFLAFSRKYIDTRLPPGAMEYDRLQYVLNHKLTTHFLEFRTGEGKRLGIIISSQQEDMFHYWFAFFDNDYRQNAPIGKWLMWQTIKWVQQSGMNYIYLGTCYGHKSLYKARDYRGVEFFDGYEWNSDLKELKRRAKEDDQTWATDRWRRDQLFPK